MSDPEKFVKPSDPHLTCGRKALLIKGVRSGIVPLPDVLNACSISPEEWMQWNADYDKAGAVGLRATRAGHRRKAAKGDIPKRK